MNILRNQRSLLKSFGPSFGGEKVALRGGKLILRIPIGCGPHGLVIVKPPSFSLTQGARDLPRDPMGFRIFTCAIWITCILAASSAPVDETWHSVDGGVLEGKGVSWTIDGINIIRKSDDQRFLVPFAKLKASDVLRGIKTLPFRVNDEARLRAKTSSTTSDKRERETGKYTAHVRLFTYDGYNFRGSGVISPIKEEYKVSGRTVEVHLSSPYGDGLAGVEFYGVKGKGRDRTIFHSEAGIRDFRGIGSTHYFSFEPVENLQGWVVVIRSPNTGEIIESQGSMSHLEDYVVSLIPEIAKVKVNTTELRKAIIKDAALRQNKEQAEGARHDLSEIFGKTYSWSSNGRDVGHRLIILEGGRGTIRGTPLTWEKVDDNRIQVSFFDGVKADLKWAADYKSFTGEEARRGGLKVAGRLVE